MTLPNVPLDQNMTPEVRRYLDAVRREIEATIGDLDALVIPSKATEAQAETGTDDTNFLTSLTGVASVLTHSPFLKFAYYEDQKAANTAGGAAAGANTYYTRTLNTEVYDAIGATLASNKVTLPAGTYLIEGSCPGFRVASHKCRLYNVTSATVIAYGTTEYSAVGTGDLVTTRTHVLAKATFAAETAIRLEHALGNTTGASDYGRAANLTGSEVYATLKIWRLD